MKSLFFVYCSITSYWFGFHLNSNFSFFIFHFSIHGYFFAAYYKCRVRRVASLCSRTPFWRFVIFHLVTCMMVWTWILLDCSYHEPHWHVVLFFLDVCFILKSQNFLWFFLNERGLISVYSCRPQRTRSQKLRFWFNATRASSTCNRVLTNIFRKSTKWSKHFFLSLDHYGLLQSLQFGSYNTTSGISSLTYSYSFYLFSCYHCSVNSSTPPCIKFCHSKYHLE